jgi:hypothetical protein
VAKLSRAGGGALYDFWPDTAINILNWLMFFALQRNAVRGQFMMHSEGLAEETSGVEHSHERSPTRALPRLSSRQSLKKVR